MKTILQNMTSQLNKLEFKHKVLSLEAETLRAVIAESKSETLLVREKLIGEHAKEISFYIYLFIRLWFDLYSYLHYVLKHQ